MCNKQHLQTDLPDWQPRGNSQLPYMRLSSFLNEKGKRPPLATERVFLWIFRQSPSSWIRRLSKQWLQLQVLQKNKKALAPGNYKGQKKTSFCGAKLCIRDFTCTRNFILTAAWCSALFYRSSNSDQERVNTLPMFTPQMRGRVRIQSCLLSMSTSFPWTMQLQPEHIGHALSILLVRGSPHISYQHQQHYGTKTKIFLNKEENHLLCVHVMVQALSCAFISHIYFSYFHIFHNCSYNNNLLLLTIWIFRLLPLPLFAVVIYSEHFHTYSFPRFEYCFRIYSRNAILMGVSIWLNNRRLYYLLC